MAPGDNDQADDQRDTYHQRYQDMFKEMLVDDISPQVCMRRQDTGQQGY
jgi:hypothetical protein